MLVKTNCVERYIFRYRSVKTDLFTLVVVRVKVTPDESPTGETHFEMQPAKWKGFPAADLTEFQ